MSDHRLAVKESGSKRKEPSVPSCDEEPRPKKEKNTTPWPQEGEDGHGTIVGYIEDAFKNNKGNNWEAWWTAVLPNALELHKIADEPPDPSEEKAWSDFWKDKKALEIKSAKERLGVDPSVNTLMTDALGHYRGKWNYPNWM